MTDTVAPIRVAMVVRLYSPWIGGTERQAASLSAELAAAGQVPTVVTGRWFRGTKRTERVRGFDVVRLPTLYEFFGIRGLRKLGGYLFIVSLFAHLVRRRDDYDVVHVHGLNYHTYAAVRACSLTGTPVVVKLANSGANSDIVKMKEDRQLKFASRMLSTALRCDRFVALNALVVDELEQAGVPADRIVRFVNGVRVIDRPEEVDGPIRVLYVGRLHGQKSLADLVQAFSLVAAADDSIECRLVGDGPERGSLETLVGSLGLADRIQFVGESEDVAAELRQGHVFVLPSLVEGMSNALLEAMSAGLAVVVSDIAGNRDVVTHEHDGLLFPQGDVDALASSIRSVANNRSERRRLGDGARRTILDGYALETVAHTYVDFYRSMLEPNNNTLEVERT